MRKPTRAVTGMARTPLLYRLAEVSRQGRSAGKRKTWTRFQAELADQGDEIEPGGAHADGERCRPRSRRAGRQGRRPASAAHDRRHRCARRPARCSGDQQVLGKRCTSPGAPEQHGAGTVDGFEGRAVPTGIDCGHAAKFEPPVRPPAAMSSPESSARQGARGVRRHERSLQGERRTSAGACARRMGTLSIITTPCIARPITADDRSAVRRRCPPIAAPRPPAPPPSAAGRSVHRRPG
jgi:hypothetical protein